ncbi:DUF1657 domain-containing protein [Halalkalibacter oceani]|uniref:DUF1657 domain-containing protein n=1 Tax=Halalkalibacter oceani TaxID=1653776 RepID=A0A9X2DQS1_9BACI|nr:DUF1657 domain-containing protein [Halalkalibacter oceani]MCM3713682.1 DUF1657 domain-containing protein [Halalkalibacter oceani]
MTVGSQLHGTLASLRSIEATLSTLAQKTEEQEAREAFHQGALKTRTVIHELAKRVHQVENEEPQYQQT